MLNHIILIGRLTRDPEMRYTSNGTPVTNFTLAVERNYQKDGETPVDYIDIDTWRKLAETCAHHLGKGRLVAVEGSMRVEKSKKGDKTYINPKVVADNVRFLDWPSDGKAKQNTNDSQQDNSNNSNEIDEDFDVPF